MTVLGAAVAVLMFIIPLMGRYSFRSVRNNALSTFFLALFVPTIIA